MMVLVGDGFGGRWIWWVMSLDLDWSDFLLVWSVKSVVGDSFEGYGSGM